MVSDDTNFTGTPLWRHSHSAPPKESAAKATAYAVNAAAQGHNKTLPWFGADGAFAAFRSVSNLSSTGPSGPGQAVPWST
jgi:hypothetical protein